MASAAMKQKTCLLLVAATCAMLASAVVMSPPTARAKPSVSGLADPGAVRAEAPSFRLITLNIAKPDLRYTVTPLVLEDMLPTAAEDAPCVPFVLPKSDVWPAILWVRPSAPSFPLRI